MKAIAFFLLLAGVATVASAKDAPADTAQIKRGEYLAIAADCAACHTAPGGKAFAGGLPMPIPMLGTIYTSNITPDEKTGIGKWSYEDFERAVRKGVDDDGDNLYPAMPYPSYAKINDADMRDLYAYFRYGVPAVQNDPPPSTIRWPLNVRWPLKLWNLVFLDTERFKPIPENSVEWNRGAYLVQGLGHCGTCHTPRGIGLQEKALDQRGGAYLSGAQLGGWFASNLTSNPTTGIGKWSAQDIVDFLKTGANSHATAFGPMTEVINNSTQWMTDQDLAAMAVYLKSLAAAGTAIPQHGPVDPKVMAHGAQVYQNYCVSCHLPNGKGTAPWLSPLAGNPNVLEGNPVSLINVTLNGTEALVIDGVPAPYPMPAHRHALTDAQIADALTFTRNSWGNQAPAVAARDVKTLREQTGHDK